jgi:hypothetical protein
MKTENQTAIPQGIPQKKMKIFNTPMLKNQKPTVVRLQNPTTVGLLYIYLHFIELFPVNLRDQWLA